jgi:2-keto-4-pentenoate hydratase
MGFESMTTATLVTKCVQYLDEAFARHESIVALTELAPGLTIDDAYSIQMERVRTAVESGDSITGKKIGLTSQAMQNLLGVDQPDYGHLHQSMVVEQGGTVSLSQLFQPKVEGEIAFVLKEDLVGPKITTEDVLKATDYVVASLEIVDSRIKDWKIKLEDTVADNASCGLYVLGTYKARDVDLKKLHMQLLKNGEVVNEGYGTDVLGDPAACVAWLANKLHQYGVSLKAGEVILSGALSAAIPVNPGDEIKATFNELGEVHVHFTE